MPASAKFKAEKIASYKYGRLSETIASLYLMLKGYRIVARNFSSHLGEIDIIAKRGKCLAMIEVKARKTPNIEVLTAKQQKRIINAAALFIAKHPEFNEVEIRFDLVILKPFSISHIIDCWRP